MNRNVSRTKQLKGMRNLKGTDFFSGETGVCRSLASHGLHGAVACPDSPAAGVEHPASRGE
jgi:hypothetical protein